MKKLILSIYMVLGILPLKISILPICVFLIPLTTNIAKSFKLYQQHRNFGYLYFLIYITAAIYPFHLFNSHYDPSYRDLAYIFSPIIMLAFSIPFLAVECKKELQYLKNLYIYLSVIICALGIFQFLNFSLVNSLLSYFETLNETQYNYFTYNLRARSIFPANPNLFGLFSATAIYVTLHYGARNIFFVPVYNCFRLY